MDSDKQASMDAEFGRLGFQGVFPVSAAHRRGLDDLRGAITAKWGEIAPETGEAVHLRPTRLAIVGRPNVGKSSLINALMAEPRAIVSPVAGTTRDAVDISYTWRNEPFLFIDTAGMRQERRVQDELERAMTGRTAHAINRADVCILVVDAGAGVTMQDKKIAGLIQGALAPCLIVVNKWDLAREQGDASKTREREYYDQVQRDLFFLSYAPVLFLSAKTGERIEGLLKTVAMIAKNRVYRFQTGPLNRVLSRAMERYAPPLVRGRRFKILYAAQQLPKEAAREIPTLQLFVNSAELLTSAYERYLDLQLREAFDLRGCPIKFVMRGRTTGERGKVHSMQTKPSPRAARRAPKKSDAKPRRNA
jgi:GTP-binding protein